MKVPCVLGRSGIAARKREGDGATPAGVFRVLSVYYRCDRVRRPPATLLMKPTRPSDGWCDAPGDRNYNRRVRLPYAGRSETLWRDDRLYDIVVTLAHNHRPRVQGLGSAIFMHVAGANRTPTEGCVALDVHHLGRLLARAGRLVCLRVGR